MSAELKKTFLDLAKALKDLHKDLLMLEAKTLESESGRKINPYELLHASLYDPNLAWLRQMSSLLVTIDTTIDEVAILTGSEANQTAAAVIALLEKPAGLIETDFWKHYSTHLANNPDIIMRHARVKELVAGLRPKM